MGFNFADRDTATGLRDLWQSQPWNDPSKTNSGVPDLALTHGWLFRAPAEGIPARDGISISSAECDAYYLDTEANELKQLYENDGVTPATSDVYQIFDTGDVAPNAYIVAIEVFGVKVVIAENC